MDDWVIAVIVRVISVSLFALLPGISSAAVLGMLPGIQSVNAPEAALSSGSQSLAEVAKKEEARRKTVKAASKVYTNDTLKADITNSVPVETPAPGTPNADSGSAQAPREPSTQVPSLNLPGGTIEPVSPEKEEARWRARIMAARAALDRSRIFADALQSRLNALATDLVNRDDPAQRAQLEMERQRAAMELDRVRKEMVEQTKTIADIEEDARKAGVPPGWLR